MLLVTDPVPFCPLSSFRGEHCKDLRSRLVSIGSKTSVLSTLSEGPPIFFVSGVRVFPPEQNPAPMTSKFVIPVDQPFRPLPACLLLHLSMEFFFYVCHFCMQ